MSTALTAPLSTRPIADRSCSQRMAARRFAFVALLLAVAACALAGWAPLGFSIVTVFLFAGPHNWLECRYFLARMPARWGGLARFFSLGLGGVLALTAAFVLWPALAARSAWSEPAWLAGAAAWNTALVLWVALLVSLRARQNPRRDWPWIWPVACMLIGLAWLKPLEWCLALVYLHPLLALWFLDRELGRSRPEWRGRYRYCLLIVPLLLAALWWKLADAPPLPGSDALSLRIAGHAGASLLPGISSHLLVSTHTFLEMLHYGVWLIAMPLAGLGAAPWRVDRTPLGRRSGIWRRVLAVLLLTGLALVLLLWAGFLADYPLTRDIYFTVAMLHVLAEVPFLLRML